MTHFATDARYKTQPLCDSQLGPGAFVPHFLQHCNKSNANYAMSASSASIETPGSAAVSLYLKPSMGWCGSINTVKAQLVKRHCTARVGDDALQAQHLFNFYCHPLPGFGGMTSTPHQPGWAAGVACCCHSTFSWVLCQHANQLAMIVADHLLPGAAHACISFEM